MLAAHCPVVVSHWYIGVYLSALAELPFLYPPTAYSRPSSTPTPSLLRAVDMGAMAAQLPVSPEAAAPAGCAQHASTTSSTSARARRCHRRWGGCSLWSTILGGE